MTTLIIEEDIKLKKTTFKTYNELKKFISTNKALYNNPEIDLIGWNDYEIKEFEKSIIIKDFNEMNENEKNINWDNIFIKGTKYNS